MKKSVWLIPALLLLLSSIAFARGEFDYLTVKGPGITGEINITNPALTADFFIFADFTQGAIDPPADPGQGYQVVRVYVETVDGKPTDRLFDQLHYYPYTGYVYYDGLVEGSSEYDGKWYTGNPAAEAPFRAALDERARLAWIPLGVLFLLLAVFWFAYRSAEKKV
jgi:hypothetical protein